MKQNDYYYNSYEVCMVAVYTICVSMLLLCLPGT